MPSTESPPVEPPKETPTAAPAPRRRFSDRMRHLSERTQHWIRRALRRLAFLLGPIVVTAILWFVMRALTNPGYATDVLTAGGISLFGAGTVVVFGQTIFQEITLGPWQLAFIVMWVNAASSFWYVYNLDLLERLPKIGPTFHRMRTEAVKTLEERRWIRRLSVVGVGAFVITPLPGSGALGGAIVARLIGVSRFAAFISISVAGVIVCTGYAMFAHKLAKSIPEVPTWQRILGALLVFGTLFLVMRWWTRRRLRQGSATEQVVVDDPSTATERAPTTPRAVSTPNAK